MLTALVGLATLLFLISNSKHATPVARAADAAVRFDRERDPRLAPFPPLDELVERDRLWPPDLGEQEL